MDASGSSRQEDDPADAQRWWDGEKWTAAITEGEAQHALEEAERALAAQYYPDVAEVRKVDALRQYVRQIATPGVDHIAAGDARNALRAAERAIAGTYYPDVADVRKVEALRQRVRDIEGWVAPPSSFLTGAQQTEPGSTTRPFSRQAAEPASGPGKVSRAIDVVDRAVNVFARVVVSLSWGAVAILLFSVDQPVWALTSSAYVVYLWVGWRGRKWLVY